MSCNIQVFNENSTGYVTWTFRDTQLLLAVPLTISYRIDNREDEAAILAPTSISPASTVIITVTPTQNAIINSALEYEEHVMTITATYGVGDSISEECVFKVKNLQFVG